MASTYVKIHETYPSMRGAVAVQRCLTDVDYLTVS